MAFVVAQEVPTSSSMAVPHGPAGVGQARHRMREQLRSNGVSDTVVDDAVLILSELLSNARRTADRWGSTRRWGTATSVPHGAWTDVAT